jgi:trichohyalin
MSLQEDFEDNKIIVGQESINTEDFKKFRQNSSSILPSANFESSIRMQKIKELNQSKKKLEKQINQINTKINMMEEENTTAILGDIEYPNSIIEENIKKDKIKDNKQTKELLLAKLNGINEQVQRLVQSEEDLNKNKKLNVKEFLENFDKDKEKSEELVKKLTEDKKIREQKMMNSIKKSYDLKQKEYEQMKLDEEEKKKKELEKIRLKELEIIRERNKENKDKLSFIKLHANDKPMNMSQYLFKALENKYNEKQENEIKTEILKKREKIKENSVSLEEIFDFEKKQKELEVKRMLEMEEEKKKLREQWKQTKDILPKFESNMMQMIKEEEKKNKEKKELEEAKKKLKQQEIKNYSESVNKLFLPKINPSMKKEREERIKNLDVKSNIQHITKKKNTGRIILKKPDPNKPSKYSWKLKLELDEPEKTNKNKNQHQLKRAKSAQKHEPLDKLPDYLTEMRLKNTQNFENKSQNKNKKNNWDQMLKNEKGNLFENVEKAKKRVEQLEEKAKMSEKLMQNSSGGIDPDLQQKVSGYLLDAIKGKLSILEKMNQQ